MGISQIKDIFNYNLSILKESKYKETAIGSTLLLFVFYSFLYGMFRIPVFDIGIVRMSPINILDMTFIILSSTLIGALIALFRYKVSVVSTSSKGMGIGSFFTGFFGVVCPACQTVSLAAFGSTVAVLSLVFLVPYIDAIRGFSLLLLGLSFYTTAKTVYTKTCPVYNVHEKTRETELKPSDELSLINNRFFLGSLIALVALVLINQFFTMSVLGSIGSYSPGGTVSISSGSFKLEYGPKKTLKPMPLAVGEQPAINGYKSKVKSLPTISELQMTPSTGDLAQDLLNNVVPKGTPWYGKEAGVSFDDPINAQNLWAKGRAIQLDGAQDERWKRIVNSFTCDYCCGSPQNPTIITRCGCAHSAAAQGMAKWFIKNYGDKFSDEEIYGEMARWYATWYPGPTIKRIIQEASSN